MASNDTQAIIERFIDSHHKSTDFADLLQGRTSDRYAKTSSSLGGVIEKRIKHNLPLEVSNRVNATIPCQLGLFSSIDHAWLIAEQELLIWDYTQDANVYTYKSPDQIIYNVAVVKSRPGVFVTQTKHILVVATSALISVHRIDIDSSSGKLQLLPSPVSTSSEGLRMSNIVGTESGRIFMVGDDGHLYELTYDKNGCRLQCRSETKSLGYLSCFFKSQPLNKVRSITVDDERQVLYILKQGPEIEAVFIGRNSAYSSLSTTGLLRPSITALCLNSKTPIRPEDLELISLHTIRKERSSTVHFFAATDNGFRVYFSCHDTSNGSIIEPIHIRFPSPLDVNQQSLFHEDCYLEKFHAPYFAHGLFVGARQKAHAMDTMQVYVANDQDYTLSGDILTEICCRFDMSGKIWAIGETVADSNNTLPKLVVLTDHHICIFDEHRPLEIFRALLRTNDTASIKTFTDQQGDMRKALLSLDIICSSKQESDIRLAKQLLAECPEADQRTATLAHFARLMSDTWKWSLPLSNEHASRLGKVQDVIKSLLKILVTVPNETKDLYTRTADVISFCRFLSDRQVPCVHAKDQTLADLIMTERGQSTVKSLVEEAIQHGSAEGTHSAHFHRYLQNECGTLVSDDDLSYYEGLEFLYNAEKDTSSEKSKADQLEASCKALSTIAGRMSSEQLNNIIDRYQSMDYYTGAMVLAIQRAKGLDPVNFTALNFTQPSEAVRIITRTLLYAAKHSNQFPEDLPIALQHVQDSSLHFRLYQWMIENSLATELVKLSTPFIEDFFTSYHDAKKGLDYRWQYYAHRKQYHAAATCLQSLASHNDDIPLGERQRYIDLAIEMEHKKDTKNTDLVQHLEQQKSLAIIQSRLLHQLQPLGSSDPLANQLLDVDTLFDVYACPNKYWDEVLLLMKLRKPDFSYLGQVWQAIIEQAGNDSGKLKSRISTLAKQLYPSIVTFPIYLIVMLLERHLGESNAPLIRDIMEDIGVSQDVLLDAYAAMSAIRHRPVSAV